MVERPTRRHGMNEFVNFSKRGVELPAGCKDLADVLSLSKKMAGAPPSPPSEAIVPEEGLEHISNYMSRLIQSPARWRSVWINALGKPPVVRLSHDSEALQSLIYFGLAREGAIRNVLKYHAINPTQFSTIPEGWYYSRFILCPLASEAISVTQFVRICSGKDLAWRPTSCSGFVTARCKNDITE